MLAGREEITLIMHRNQDTDYSHIIIVLRSYTEKSGLTSKYMTWQQTSNRNKRRRSGRLKNI